MDAECEEAREETGKVFEFVSCDVVGFVGHVEEMACWCYVEEVVDYSVD